MPIKIIGKRPTISIVEMNYGCGRSHGSFGINQKHANITRMHLRNCTNEFIKGLIPPTASNNARSLPNRGNFRTVFRKPCLQLRSVLSVSPPPST